MMHELIGKEVEVQTIEIIYRGKLIEIGESDIYLQSDYGWITIPIEKIADVKLVESE
jgi:hypothetical protein